MTTTAPAPPKSTIVRATNAQLRTLRTGLAITQRITPGLAQRWAARLWCTLPTGRSRVVDRRPQAGDRAVVLLPGGRSVIAESWGQGSPVYLVHGWGGQRGQLGSFVTPLLDAGHRVVAFDAPSHGESAAGSLGAGRSTALEIAEALQAVVRRFGPAAGVVAHSLGAVSTVVAMADGLVTPRVVFVAPAVSPMDSIVMFASTLGLSARTRDGMVRRLESLVGRPIADFDVLADLPGTRPPALVIHDRTDREMPYEKAVRLVDAWPESELLSTEGLGHHRLLADDTVIEAATAYLSA